MPTSLTEGMDVPADSADLPAGRTGGILQRLPVTLQPDRNLLRYYMLSALLFGPAVLFAAVPLYFRFRTLRYDIDEEGLTMRWGILFRREVSLTYARIQDIQLTSNVVERWLGLARIQLQTASGSSTAEMTVEGLRDVEAMRDFLYSRMRGVSAASGAAVDDPPANPRLVGRSPDAPDHDAAALNGYVPARGSAEPRTHPSAPEIAELTATLEAVAAELRALRGRVRVTDAGGDDA